MNNRLILPFKCLTVVGFLFISTVPAHADDLKAFCKGVGSAACAAEKKKDWAVVIKELKTLVDKKNATAMGWLAWFYSKGKGVPKDLLTSRTLAEGALNIAEQLSPEMIGMIKKLKMRIESDIAYGYLVGEEGFPRSAKKALLWFERLKESDSADKKIDGIIVDLKTEISQDAARKERKRGELLLQDFVYGSDIRKLENLGKSVETLCKRDIKCAFDKVWAYLDITKDGRLSLSEIARFQRNIVKFSVAHQNKNKLKTEDLVAINLASIIFFPITASSILHSFDYNNDGVLSKKEVFGDTEFSKLVGVDVDTLATGLDFQSLGKKLQDSMGNIPFLK